MDETRRAQIHTIVEHFRGKAVTQNVIEEFCNRNKIQPVTKGELEDYTVQVDHDAKVSVLFKEVVEELQNLAYLPEFAPKKTREDIKKANEEVEINIAKLFEKNGLKYNFVSGTTDEIGRTLQGVVMSGGNRVFNKATSVLMHLAKEKFGEDFNSKHSAEWWEEKFGDLNKEVKEKTEEAEK